MVLLPLPAPLGADNWRIRGSLMIRDTRKVKWGCSHHLKQPKWNKTLGRWENDRRVLILMPDCPRHLGIVTVLQRSWFYVGR